VKRRGSLATTSPPPLGGAASIPLGACRGGTVALVVAALALALAGCKACDRGGAHPDAGDHAQPESLTPEQAAKVLARVGDKTITLGDYAAALEHMDQFDRLRYQSPERRKELLQEMITVELLAKEAVDKGYDKEPLAEQELRAILRDATLAEARKGAPLPNDIPESEVRAYFDGRRADYKDPERRRISVVVLADEASAQRALESAKAVKTSSDWGELVRARSIDPQARANVPLDLAGDLGIVSPPDDPRGENPRVPPEVRAAAFGPTEETGVAPVLVRSGGRFWIVRVTQTLPPHERTFEEAERSIRVKLAQDKLRAREDALLDELRKTVKVEIDEAALATVKVPATGGAGVAPDAGPR
jgi:peptidyl-prolyl cis-trans isomerase C